MNRIITTFLVMSIINVINAGTNWMPISANVPSDAKITLHNSDIQSSVLNFKTQGFWLKEVITSKGSAVIIETEEGTPILDNNAPDLEKLTASVIIPNSDRMKVNIVSSDYSEYYDILVAPSKGNLLRTVDPSDIPYNFGEVYNRDEFYPGNLAELRDPYILKDFRGQTVVIYPFQYNPVEKILRVYHNITVEIISTEETGINVKENTREISSFDLEYKNIYSEHFENFNSSRYDVLAEQGNMLIISYGSFMDEMEPFVEWKNMKGIPTEMVSESDAGGSAASIANFVEDYYYTNGLTFLLLVGDVSQVPSLMVGGSASDPSYGFIEGNDSYGEVIVGRFSAENSSHVNTQVERVINYERYPTANGDWYTTALGIASNQGPGDDNENDCEHVENINEILTDYNYQNSSEICDPSGTVSQGVNAINAGVSVINYTGHGSQNSWGNGAALDNGDVNGLTNTDKLPFIWSVACVNGEFHTGTCFAETWLRATNDGEPSGAIGFFGSTVNQSWSPPMEGQDEFNDILTETYSDNIKRTYGGLSVNGCMKMNDSYGSSGEYESDYWTLFGDPSVTVRTSEPENFVIDHPDFILIGSEVFEVSTGQEGALATISSEGELIAYAYADVYGFATIIFDEPISNGGEMDLVVTGYNHFPYEIELMAMSPEGPYVVIDEVNLVGEGNDNGLIDWGETVEVSLVAYNVGIDAALSVTATASSDDPYIYNFGSSVSFEEIFPEGYSTSDSPIIFSVTPDAPEGYSAGIDVEFTGTDASGNDYEWMSSFTVMIYHNCVLGDINADGGLNILDIVRVVNIIINFGDSISEFEECSAEINGDGTINILDIINIINMVLDESRPVFSEIGNTSTMYLGLNSANINSDGPIAGIEMKVIADQLMVNPGLEMDIALNKIDDTYYILIYSIDGNVIFGDTQLFSTNNEFEITHIVVANTEGEEVFVLYDVLPEKFTLHQNYPNPFNPVTSISFNISNQSPVKLIISDLLGREVVTLMDEIKSGGYYTIEWDALNSSGNIIPSGIYVYQLITNEGILSRKMIFMK